MVTGLDCRQNRSAAAAIVFQDNERFVIHLAIASKKIPHHRMNAPRRFSEKKLEQIDKMNAVGERYARVLAWTLKAAEICAQHFDLAEALLRNRVAHPDRGRIEPENVSDLQNQSVAFRQLLQFPRLSRFLPRRLFVKHVRSIFHLVAAYLIKSMR